MAKKLKLPVGIEDFKEIRQGNFYYIDKTRLMEQLLDRCAKVNLFTRPRRFGKTLNMSMLRHFFEIGTDKTLFGGLYISQNKELCEEYMGQYPVVFLSLKNVEGLTFEGAKSQFVELVGREAKRFRFLLESEKLDEEDKSRYQALIDMQNGQYAMNDDTLTFSLQSLSELLYKHYGKKTIILIDEYDVPLDKAFQNGYYREMVSLIRSMFGMALKTNEFLQFAVLTGCLRISKESIFTGLNNFKVLSIMDPQFDEQFGFTEAEVKGILDSYNLADHMDEIKEWYDGYHFGNADVYCPWDVINHVDQLRADPTAQPQSYWMNTSGNGLVKRFVDMADKTTRDEIERLVCGEAIEKPVRLELTYDEIDTSIDNLWSVLFTTGYLTQVGCVERGVYKLCIPNKEVREIFVLQIQEWFKKTVLKKNDSVGEFCRALEAGNAEVMEKQLTRIMGKMISIMDTKARDDQKENFYHGILLGLLRSEEEWLILSNAESGEGFCDILVEPENPDAGIIIELKYSATFAGLEGMCERALSQIRERRYDERLRNDGRNELLAYGIAFCKKRCRVKMEKLESDIIKEVSG